MTAIMNNPDAQCDNMVKWWLLFTTYLCDVLVLSIKTNYHPKQIIIDLIHSSELLMCNSKDISPFLQQIEKEIFHKFTTSIVLTLEHGKARSFTV